MFRHTVCFQFKPTTPIETIHAILTAIGNLQQTIPGIINYSWGKNNQESTSTGKYDYCFIMDFDSQASRTAYQQHPNHLAIIEQQIIPHMAEGFVLDYDVGTGIEEISEQRSINPSPLHTAAPSSTYKQITFFQFTPSASETDITKFFEAIKASHREVPDITFSQGHNQEVTSNNLFKHCFVISFESQESLEEYQASNRMTTIIASDRPYINSSPFENILASTMAFSCMPNPVPDIDPTLKKSIKELMKFSVPYMASAVVDVSRTFISNAFLAKLGGDSNAAGAIIYTSQLVLISVSCFSYAIGSEVGKIVKIVSFKRIPNESETELQSRIDNYQIQKGQALSELATSSLLFANTLSIPLIVFCVCTRPIFTTFGQDKNVVELAGQYYDGYVWGVPASTMLAFLRQFVLGHGKPQDAYVILSSMLLNTITASGLGYLMTFGLGKIPAGNITGLGYASSIAFWINLVALTTYVASSNRYSPRVNILVRKAWENLQKWSKIIATVGGGVTVRVSSEFISLFFLTLMVSEFGDDALAAEQIANQYAFLMIVPLFGLTQATTIKASHYFPSANKKLIKQTTHSGIIVGTCISMLMCSVIFAAPTPLISLFTNTEENSETYQIARKLLYIVAAIQLPDGPKNIVCGVLNAMKDPYTPLMSGVGINVIIALALGYVLAFPGKLETEGLFYARLITTIAALCMLLDALPKKVENYGKTASTATTTTPLTVSSTRYSWFSGNGSMGNALMLKEALLPASQNTSLKTYPPVEDTQYIEDQKDLENGKNDVVYSF